MRPVIAVVVKNLKNAVDRSTMHNYETLIKLFDNCFKETYNTRLMSGSDEPIYLPASENCAFHRIVFANGFFSSALHECAHWFIAGEKRRQLIDFGYWYNPDGRTPAQQSLFEKVEIKPQALEWILSVAANYSFRMSLDNLNGISTNSTPFKLAIYEQVKNYLNNGLPQRAEIFKNVICETYKTPKLMTLNQFDLSII